MPVTIHRHMGLAASDLQKRQKKEKAMKGSQGYKRDPSLGESLRHHHPSTLIYRLFQTHAN